MPNSGKLGGSSIIPTIRYRDTKEAVDWLCEAFGFEKHLVVMDDAATIAHAQLILGEVDPKNWTRR